MAQQAQHLSPEVAVVGDHDPTMMTHQAIDRTTGLLPPSFRCSWLPTPQASGSLVENLDGVWIAPGSPYRDADAVLAAIETARIRGIPLLAICGGFQHVVIEYVRSVLDLPADHAEVAPESAHPAITPLRCSLVGVEEVVHPVADTILQSITGSDPFVGFYFCSYGVNPALVPALAANGMIVNARDEEGGVRGVELDDHPFYLATLFQPQMEVNRTLRLPPLIEAWSQAVELRARQRSTS